MSNRSTSSTSLTFCFHLPYVNVRGDEKEVLLLERLAFETMTEVIIPKLIEIEKEINQKNQCGPKSYGISASFLQVIDELNFINRYIDYLKEKAFQTKNDQLVSEALLYTEEHSDLIKHLRALQLAGQVEWIPTTATLAYLPYILHKEWELAQLMTGAKVYKQYFGYSPKKNYIQNRDCTYEQKMKNNHWIYRYIHKVEERALEILSMGQLGDSQIHQKAADQMIRELFLAQSADWPEMMNHPKRYDYALHRVKLHVSRCNHIYEQWKQNSFEVALLEEWKEEYPLFKDINLSEPFIGANEMVAVTQENVCKQERIAMLSWEYPPKIVGGLARAVRDLSVALAEQGKEVHVFTCQVKGHPNYEIEDGVHIHRIPTLTEEEDTPFFQWIFQFNIQTIDYIKNLAQQVTFDLIHAHDWLVCWAAKELKHSLGVPLIATIHATEYGRNGGIWTEQQSRIHQLEWELTYEAYSVIVCSHYMKYELRDLFQLPEDKIVILPNGVDLSQLQSTHNQMRDRFSLPHEKLVLFIGRMVNEKGVHFLLDVAPGILEKVPETKFICCGKGPMLEHWKSVVQEKGLEHKVVFTGFIDDDTRNALLHEAYATVFPSLYEPFGIVALEAMASNGLVIASDTGGLREIIEHRNDGLKIYPGHTQSLYDQLLFALTHEEEMDYLRERAKKKVNELYQWNVIARQTADLYEKHLSKNGEVFVI